MVVKISRELKGYRDNLERIDAAFPGREMLTATEIARWLGCSPDKVRRDFRFSAALRRISKADLARQMTAG